MHADLKKSRWSLFILAPLSVNIEPKLTLLYQFIPNFIIRCFTRFNPRITFIQYLYL